MDGLPPLSTVLSLLTRRGLLDEAALDRLRRLEAESGEDAHRIAAKLGLVAERDFAAAYAELLGSPLVGPGDFPAEPVAAERISRPFARHAKVVPLRETETEVEVAMADPMDQASLRALAFALDKPVLRRAALPSDVEAALERLYGEGRSDLARAGEAAGERDDEDRDADLERLQDLASEAPVIRLVHALITRAVETRASDIHLEATEAGLRVRYRIDGVLRETEAPPARLNIAERRLAQHGRIRLAVRGIALALLLAAGPALAQSDPPQLAPTRPYRATLEERFREANTTNDGRLTFAQALARMPSVAHEFDAIDKDRKGWVALDDIRAHQAKKRRLRRVKPPPPEG